MENKEIEAVNELLSKIPDEVLAEAAGGLDKRAIIALSAAGIVLAGGLGIYAFANRKGGSNAVSGQGVPGTTDRPRTNVNTPAVKPKVVQIPKEQTETEKEKEEEEIKNPIQHAIKSDAAVRSILDLVRKKGKAKDLAGMLKKYGSEYGVKINSSDRNTVLGGWEMARTDVQEKYEKDDGSLLGVYNEYAKLVRGKKFSGNEEEVREIVATWPELKK